MHQGFKNKKYETQVLKKIEKNWSSPKNSFGKIIFSNCFVVSNIKNVNVRQVKSLTWDSRASTTGKDF